ncbi:hypothetical protein VUR80DRAFT_2284 [Thermomyces stellatus]
MRLPTNSRQPSNQIVADGAGVRSEGSKGPELRGWKIIFLWGSRLHISHSELKNRGAPRISRLYQSQSPQESPICRSVFNSPVWPAIVLRKPKPANR